MLKTLTSLWEELILSVSISSSTQSLPRDTIKLHTCKSIAFAIPSGVLPHHLSHAHTIWSALTPQSMGNSRGVTET